MTFTQQLGEYVRACFSGIWIESHEHQDAIMAIAQLCREESWQLATWDIEQGFFTGSDTENTGAAGVGKSAFAKALGAETGRPTLTLDIGALMGSLVGQTEGNVRKALQIADAMAPSILFIDEVEKALSGAAGGALDSGVSARLFGTLLTWMNDRDSDVFLIATCNDVSKLPPEFVRAERFDGVFFLDLPSEEQREQIWRIHMQNFGIDPDQRRPDDSQWTGAEVRSCCRLAALLDLSQIDAAQNVVPIAVMAAETVENLRSWASGRCLSADRAGIYRHESQPKSRRHVSRNPSRN